MVLYICSHYTDLIYHTNPADTSNIPPTLDGTETFHYPRGSVCNTSKVYPILIAIP